MESRDLPIYAVERQLVREAGRLRRLVVTAPTGSGKSTQVPQMLLDGGAAGEGRIIVLQPRRIAARMLAARVARERGSRPGAEVGYQVRFEDVSSAATRIQYVTEGVLLRRLLVDPQLRGVSALIFDEFHERHLEGDLALALARSLQGSGRPDLLLVAMSATLEVEPLRRYLDPCGFVSAEGRTHPVTIEHIDRPLDFGRTPVWDAAAAALEQVVADGAEPDVLVFMPGAYEIGRTVQAVRALRCARGWSVLPLHGELPAEAQDAAVAPSDRPRVIVATNVAETSLTIEGIRTVIDSGLARIPKFDPYRGINTLLVESISRASADQRAGRAGRTAPGRCLRLWTLREHEGRRAADPPEVRRLDLAEAVLSLRGLGVRDARAFPWLDAPEERAVARAETLLDDLEAIDGAGGPITALGRRMLAFPAHPRHARMMIAAADYGCVREAALIAAVIQGRSLLVRRPGDEAEELRGRELGDETESDLFLLLRAWEYARDRGFDLEACRRVGIHAVTARQVEEVFERFLAVARRQGLAAGGEAAPVEALAKTLLTAFPDHVAQRVDGGTLRCRLVHGRRGTLARESVVRRSPLLVAAEIREVEGSEVNTLLSLATAIRAEWLDELFPQHVRERQSVELDAAAGRVVARAERTYHDLVLGARRLDRPPEAEAAALLAAEALKGRLALRHWDEGVDQWLLRVNRLARWCPELGIPAFTDDDRALVIQQLCLGCVSLKDVRERPVLPVVKAWLSGSQRDLVERHAPERVELSNGRRARVTYTPDAEPFIEQRIQDLYGVSELPRIALGRARLLVHVLAPNQRPVQVTDDLKGFWREHYPKVKQQLQRRYPKHEWR